MKAAYYEEFGGADKIIIGELAKPEAGPGELVIRIVATSVNPIDWKIREGHFECVFEHVFPIVPGWDAAGTVDALGEGVEGFNVGDAVFAYTRKSRAHDGTYAGYIAIPAGMVAPIPDGLSFEQAAAIPLCALTAWQSLVGFADIQPGQTVLIQAGAGGVGSMAIQIAKLKGARVLTTAGAANADYCRSLGADEVIDYSAGDAVEVARQITPDGIDCLFEMVWDTEDQAQLDRFLGLIRDGGAVVTLNMPANEEIVAAKGLRSLRLFSEPVGDELAMLGRLFVEGKLRLPEIRTLPLEQAGEAMLVSQQGHVRGKIVLTI